MTASGSGYYSSTTGSPGSDRDQDRDVFRTSAGYGSDSNKLFVDPYLVRRKEKERKTMEVKAASKAVARKATDLRPAGKKPPVGELVAFFQNTKD